MCDMSYDKPVMGLQPCIAMTESVPTAIRLPQLPFRYDRHSTVMQTAGSTKLPISVTLTTKRSGVLHAD